MPVKIFTSADGLGSSFVDSMFRDSRGFMWFCTRDGLSRFDGSQFVTYQIGDKVSPPGIEVIYETRNGTYWITTTGGLYRFNPNTHFTPTVTKDGRPILNAEFISPSRGGLFEDSKGNLWLTSGGLSRLEEKDGKVDFQKIELNLPGEANQNYDVSDITEADDGSLWLITTHGLVRRLSDERVIFYPYQLALTAGIVALLLDNENRVWAKLGLELFIIKPEPLESFSNLGQTTIKQLKPTSTIELRTGEEIRMPENPGEILEILSKDYFRQWGLRSIYETSNGHIWMTSVKALFEYDGRVFHRYDSSQGLTTLMGRMGEDSAGNMWFGGHAGLLRLDRKGITSYGESDGLNSARLFSISESQDGTIYISSGDFYLTKFDGKDFQTVKLKIPVSAKSIWTSRFAFLDRKGEWWILTNEKLYRFAAVSDFAALDGREPLATYGIGDGLESNVIFQIFEDKRGDIWVSTRGASVKERSLASWNRAENKFFTFTEKENFPADKSTSSFVEDKHGNLWLGFYEGGLARYANGRFTLFTEKNGLPGGVISDLLVDKTGRIWLSSALGGLQRIDDANAEHPQFVSFTTDNGLSSNNIRTITEDFYGNLYLGTARGIDRFTPQTGRVKHYSVNDGLATDFVVDSHCDKNGNLWFATTNGLSRLVPAEDEKASAPTIWIGGLRIASEAQSISELGTTEIDKGELGYTQNNFQIDFFGLDFRAGETLRYQYKLEGADSDWSPPTEIRTVTYSTIQPGTYRFLVRAVNSDNIASEIPAVISFKILPPIWLRWWFIALNVLLVVALVVGFYRYRMARLEETNLALTEAKLAEEKLSESRQERLIELEKVRSRIATDLHDDIGASLTQIAILSEVAQAQSEKGILTSTESLTKITKVSNELVNTMSDIVWSINPTKDHLSDLLRRMRRFAWDSLSAKGITFQFDSPTINDGISIGTNTRREYYLVFKEGINNIVKHSNAKSVMVEFHATDESLTLKIRDDGKGFDSNNFDNSGNGVLSMKKRAQEMGGELEIISKADEGTEIILKLPLAKKNIFEPTVRAGGES